MLLLYVSYFETTTNNQITNVCLRTRITHESITTLSQVGRCQMIHAFTLSSWNCDSQLSVTTTQTYSDEADFQTCRWNKRHHLIFTNSSTRRQEASKDPHCTGVSALTPHVTQTPTRTSPLYYSIFFINMIINHYGLFFFWGYGLAATCILACVIILLARATTDFSKNLIYLQGLV